MRKNDSIIKTAEQHKHGGETVIRHASSFFYAESNHTAGDIADALSRDMSITTLCVTDESGRAAGLVVRNDLMNIMGMKFGRELYYNKPIHELMVQAGIIYYKRSIYSVIDEVKTGFSGSLNTYYILVDGEMKFKGIISSNDMVLFLSSMMMNDLAAARRIQRAMMKENIYDTSGRAEISLATRMAGEIGGDFHYLKKKPGRNSTLSVCDVSGKGVRAALVSVALRGMFEAHENVTGMEELIVRLNSFIYSLFQGEIFITGIFLSLDEETGSMELYDMGHSMCYIISGTNCRRIKSPESNLPLGITPGLNPRPSSVELSPSDIFLSFTDGIPEQSGNMDETYGEKRALSCVMKSRLFPADRITSGLLEEITDFRTGHAQNDDMTVCVIKMQ